MELNCESPQEQKINVCVCTSICLSVKLQLFFSGQGGEREGGLMSARAHTFSTLAYTHTHMQTRTCTHTYTLQATKCNLLCRNEKGKQTSFLVFPSQSVCICVYGLEMGGYSLWLSQSAKCHAPPPPSPIYSPICNDINMSPIMKPVS